MKTLKQIVKFTRILFEREIIPFIKRTMMFFFKLGILLLFTAGIIYTEVSITRKIIEQDIWKESDVLECCIIGFFLIDLVIYAILSYFYIFRKDIFEYLEDLWREAKQ